MKYGFKTADCQVCMVDTFISHVIFYTFSSKTIKNPQNKNISQVNDDYSDNAFCHHHYVSFLANRPRNIVCFYANIYIYTNLNFLRTVYF